MDFDFLKEVKTLYKKKSWYIYLIALSGGVGIVLGFTESSLLGFQGPVMPPSPNTASGHLIPPVFFSLSPFSLRIFKFFNYFYPYWSDFCLFVCHYYWKCKLERYHLEFAGLMVRQVSKRVETMKCRSRCLKWLGKQAEPCRSEFPEVCSKEHCSLSMLGSKWAPYPQKLRDLCMPYI